MRSKLLFLAIAASLLCLTGCDLEDMGGFERFHSDFHFTYDLKTGGMLSLESFNGSVEISQWDQSTVDISGTKYGPSQAEADNLKIDISHSPDSVSIRVPRPSYPRNHLGAKFVIKAPRGVRLDRIITSNGGLRILEGTGPSRLQTSNGSVRVERLQGRADVQTSNGTVELMDVEGDATVRTSNGRIRVERLGGSLDADTSNGSVIVAAERPDRPVRVDSSNGSIEVSLPPGFRAGVRVHTSNSSITLRLPSDLNAEINAHTSNSSISSDFEMRARGSLNRNHLEAVVGSGGPLLDLSTSNGGIRLLKR